MLVPFVTKYNCEDYNKRFIINGFSIAVLFSAFIYLDYFGIQNKFLNTIFVTVAFILLLKSHKKSVFFAGFFIGILWFWWIGKSFVYYHLSYLIPFVIIGIGLIYGLLFYLTAIFKNIFIRTFFLIALNFIEPFGFNWFKLELPFQNTYFIQQKNHPIKKPNLKIYLPQYKIDQNIKWDRKYLDKILKYNFSIIQKAIENKYDIVILPETAFPLALNKNKNLIEILKYFSTKITIITGGLNLQNNLYNNSTYLFNNNKIKIANKVVLVPFGEAIPLPSILRTWINKIFFDGAPDYIPAKTATTFEIKGIKFRNAICYEATTDKIYKNLDTNYVIAISNNAWFMPSIEATLQKLLLQYYARKYNLMIFHSTNMSQSSIIY